MWYFWMFGATLHSCGTLRDSASMSRRSKSTSASWAAHGDVQGHGILEGLAAGHVARQYGLVAVLVVTLAQLDGDTPGAQEQLLAVGVGGQCGAVARQGQAEGFGQAVHRVGGEHARAAAAGGAGAALVFGDLLVGAGIVGGHHHGVDQVQAVVGQLRLAGFHRAAGDEHHRDVQAQGGHQHAGGDLVAVADADDGVGAMRIDHVLHGVGDDLARRQRIEHAVVTHGDAVVDRDGVEFLGHAAVLLDLAGDQLAHVFEVHVAGDELGEGVGDGDDRLLEVFILHAGGAP